MRRQAKWREPCGCRSRVPLHPSRTESRTTMLEELHAKSEARARPPGGWADGAVTRRRSSVFLSTVLTTLLVASSAPTPLYRVYQESWHLSSVTVTVVYGVYCLSVLVALLTVG